jgi:hypothetical protein
VLSKNGQHNKRFDSRAAWLTQELYAVHFGPPRVTKAVIRALNIQHMLWVEDAEGTPIAATMLMRHSHLKYDHGERRREKKREKKREVKDLCASVKIFLSFCDILVWNSALDQNTENRSRVSLYHSLIKISSSSAPMP